MVLPSYLYSNFIIKAGGQVNNNLAAVNNNLINHTSVFNKLSNGFSGNVYVYKSKYIAQIFLSLTSTSKLDFGIITEVVDLKEIITPVTYAEYTVFGALNYGKRQPAGVLLDGNSKLSVLNLSDQYINQINGSFTVLIS